MLARRWGHWAWRSHDKCPAACIIGGNDLGIGIGEGSRLAEASCGFLCQGHGNNTIQSRRETTAPGTGRWNQHGCVFFSNLLKGFPSEDAVACEHAIQYSTQRV